MAKNRTRINRRWSDFHCLNDKMAVIYLSHLLPVSNLIDLNKNDLSGWREDEISDFNNVLSSKTPAPRAAVISSRHVKRRGRDLRGEDFLFGGHARIRFWGSLATFLMRIMWKGSEAQTEEKNTTECDSNVCKA